MTIMTSFDYCGDPYDSLDACDSFTNPDRIIQPETIDDFIEFIKMGSTIKDQLVKQTKYETSEFIFRCLRAIINEQVEMRLLTGSEGDYIYSAVEDLAIKKGYAAC